MRSQLHGATPFASATQAWALGEPPKLIHLLSLCGEARSTYSTLNFKELSSCQAMGNLAHFHNEIKQTKVGQLRASLRWSFLLSSEGRWGCVCQALRASQPALQGINLGKIFLNFLCLTHTDQDSSTSHTLSGAFANTCARDFFPCQLQVIYSCRRLEVNRTGRLSLDGHAASANLGQSEVPSLCAQAGHLYCQNDMYVGLSV